MHRTLEFLLHHGYALLLGWVFAEQVGLPVPSMPLLLAAGALAGTGRLSFFASLFYVMLAAVAADFMWYQLGRRKGIKILQLLCKISLEPDSCVRRAEAFFQSRGPARFCWPSFSWSEHRRATACGHLSHACAAFPPLFDALGSLLWAGTFLGLGYIFSGEIERLAEYLASLGGWLLVLILGVLAAYITYKLSPASAFCATCASHASPWTN